MEKRLSRAASTLLKQQKRKTEKTFLLSNQRNLRSDHGGKEKTAQAAAEGVKLVPECEAELKRADQATIQDLLSSDAFIGSIAIHK